jgi:hypothetical protein
VFSNSIRKASVNGKNGLICALTFNARKL